MEVTPSCHLENEILAVWTVTSRYSSVDPAGRMQIRSGVGDRWGKQLLKAKENPEHQAHTDTANRKIRKRVVLPPTGREIASAFYQLNLEHRYFKSCLRRFNRTENEWRECCNNAKQTPRHPPLNCSNHYFSSILLPAGR